MLSGSSNSWGKPEQAPNAKCLNISHNTYWHLLHIAKKLVHVTLTAKQQKHTSIAKGYLMTSFHGQNEASLFCFGPFHRWMYTDYKQSDYTRIDNLSYSYMQGLYACSSTASPDYSKRWFRIKSVLITHTHTHTHTHTSNNNNNINDCTTHTKYLMRLCASTISAKQ